MDDGQTQLWRFGDVSFDEAALVLAVKGEPVELEHRPREMLLLLLHHAGDVVTKDALYETLWPGRLVSEASLAKCASRLRQAIGDVDQTLIRTVHGIGYRLAAEVSVAAAPVKAAAVKAFEPRPDDPVPRRPNWVLVRRLGRGGFGDAWLGRQPKTGEHRVFKFAEDGNELAALRREVTLFRLLREGLGGREDVARVLDWDFERSPYFIELEWYRDGNLAEWAEARGGAGAVPLEDRVALVARIADALAAAHSLGILHKDVKPSNVLIDRAVDGIPGIRLADFGSGRLLDPARLAEYGITRMDMGATGLADESTSGTPLYRAPELLAGRPQTVQADIYALGVMLYQLVVGDLERPLSADWERDVEDPLLREDIAAAAAGDPARRLGDATLLAERLRGLDQRRQERAAAERARDDLERSQRLLERARARRAPLLVLAAVLMVGFGTSTWLYWRASLASAQATREASRAAEVTRFLTDDLFSAANPLLDADPNVKVKDLLAAATRDLDRRFPAGTLDRAAIEEAIGGAYAGLLDDVHATALLDDAIAIRTRLLGAGAPETRALRLTLIRLAQRRLDMPLLLANGQAILDAAKDGPPLDAETELRARYAVAYADCKTNASAAPCLDRFRALFEETKRRLGAKADFTVQLEAEIGYQDGVDQKLDEGIAFGREALALTRERYGDNHVLTAERQFQLAQTLAEAGQSDEAMALLTQARATVLAASGRETEMTARIDAQLGKALVAAKRYDEALVASRRALDFHLATRGEEFIGTVTAMNDVANICSYLGRYDEAIELGQKVYHLQVRLVGREDTESIWFANNLATFYEHAGDLAAAERWYREAVASGRKRYAHGEWDLGHFDWHLGAVLAREGHVDEARTVLTESVTILTASLGPDNARTKRARDALEALAAPAAAAR